MPATAATARKGTNHRATAPTAEDITSGKLVLQSIERQSPTQEAAGTRGQAPSVGQSRPATLVQFEAESLAQRTIANR
jgi:hypothetical protein